MYSYHIETFPKIFETYFLQIAQVHNNNIEANQPKLFA